MIESYYVHYNGAAVFVKVAAFFEDQGGLTSQWGKAWKGPINAISIDEARDKGYALFGIERSYHQRILGT